MIYQRLVRHLFQPLVLWQSGDLGQLRWLTEFERTQHLSAEALRDLQTTRLRRLLTHAYENCPFYRERMRRSGFSPDTIRNLEDVQRLPVLEKSDIQQHRERMVAVNWPRHDLIDNQTGGSTGTPISFCLSHDRRRSRAAATIRHNRWAGWDVGDSVAVLWGAPRDLPADDWRSRLRGLLMRRPLWLDTGHVTEERLIEYNRLLHTHRPRIIQAYARSLLLFARFLKSKGLAPYQPHSIVLSAEALEPEERAEVEQIFRCPLFNRYGCREVSVVASECDAHDGLHVMAEGLYVEIVIGDRPAKPGERGSILVTDLLNFAMPLIRYRIGDMGSWANQPCSCGRALPKLQSVQGRVTDFIVGSDGRLVSGVFLATYLLAHRPSLGQVQMIQERVGEILYRVQPSRQFNPVADIEYLQKKTREYLGDTMTMRCQQVESLAAEASGKFLYCRSNVAPTYV